MMRRRGKIFSSSLDLKGGKKEDKGEKRDEAEDDGYRGFGDFDSGVDGLDVGGEWVSGGEGSGGD